MTAGGEDGLVPYIDLAHGLADAAAPIVLDYFQGDIEINTKSDESPVTAADREAETAMRALIAQAFPDHGILGEEHGAERLDAEYVWVLDPIDGTKSFVTGKPLFGTLIALLERGAPVVGVMDIPALGERWVGARGRATTHNAAPVQGARRTADISAAWLYATTPEMFEGANADAFARLRGKVKNAVYGADCYAYGLLAGGHVDLVCEANMQPYDYCALVPIISGAGGVISDWRGGALGLEGDGTVLAAATAELHAAAMAALEG